MGREVAERRAALIGALALLLATAVIQAQPAAEPAAAPSSAPAPSGSLVASAKLADNNGRTVCQFSVQGTASQGDVSALSLNSGAGGSELVGANISCTGNRLNLVGGPLLDPFSSAFVGVNYVTAVELPGATLVISDTEVDIEDSVFSGLSFFGQAALVLAHSNVTFVNTTFSANNNSAAGAIYANDSSNVMLLDSAFLGNGGGQGGAITLWNSSITANGTIFSNNSGRSSGGAISAHNMSSVVVITNTFVGNSAENGGALSIDQCDRAAINDNTFARNKATRSGGGIFQNKCSGDLSTNYFKLNSALNGGSVWQNDCKKIVHRGSRFDNNTAERGSAGIEMNQVTSADIVSCTFTTGKGAKGSGVYLQGVQGNVRECVFQANQADFGGAVFRGSADGDITGSIFVDNRAKTIGGAIYDSHAKGDISGNTFQDNIAPKGKAIFRTVSAGDISDNKRLDEDTQVVIDNPASN